MAVNISGLRRNIKNVAHNYTDAQVKVREATSNDPWGPSSTMMSEIADLTYNVVAFSEIMQMVWKRLNDHGKNWRHVYKALVLLEYLIKTGSDKVAQQCKENIFAIQTLKDFQYIDDNKDQGINVREKAKTLVALLKDDERLKNERVRALKAKERFAQSTAGIGSNTVYNSREYDTQIFRQASPTSDLNGLSELESARPQTAGEEELQLQLALAMSREEAEQEETKSRSDDMRLALALQKSKAEDANEYSIAEKNVNEGSSAIKDLVDLNFGSYDALQPTPPLRTSASLDPWGMPINDAKKTDDFSQNSSRVNDPWSPIQESTNSSDKGENSTNESNPWILNSNESTDNVFSIASQNQLVEFDHLRQDIESTIFSRKDEERNVENPFDLNDMRSVINNEELNSETGAKPKKSVEKLLGEHSNLVNLDNLISAGSQTSRNPFENNPPNPFQSVKTAKPPMNELLQQNGWTQESNKEFNPFFN